MKIKKYISIMFLALTASYTFTACNDDDSLGEAPRLFRPVTSLEVKNNNLTATWENIKGAQDYILELYRVTGTDDQGNNTYEYLSEVSCPSSPYTFEGLNWDEKYMVKIKCKGMGKESEQYQTLDANIAYISRLSGTKAIDNAVRISWKEATSANADIIKAIKIVAETTTPETATIAEGEEGNEVTERVELVSEAELNAGYKDIFSLTPETKYTFYVYKDAETLDNSTYAGKLSTKTTATPNFEETFPNGYVDLRNQPDKDPETIFQDAEFWNTITEGMGIILAGETDYYIQTNDFAFSNSISFMTGPTLGKNARIVMDKIMKGSGDIEKIEFNNIDFCSIKVVEAEQAGKDYIKGNTDKGFGGKQIFSPNNSNSTINNLIFKSCNISGFRSLVRSQASSDVFKNILFDGCTINGVGDQGVVTTNGKNAPAWETVTFKDCTILNVVFLCDLRNTDTPAPTVNVENCTFCYAPAERWDKGDYSLFRFGKNSVTLNLTNCLFGPSMYTGKESGSAVVTYTAGVKGSNLLDGANATVSSSHSYKTNFTWAACSNGNTYPIDGLLPLDFNEKSLWQDPENGDFKVIGIIGEDGIGASKWF